MTYIAGKSRSRVAIMSNWSFSCSLRSGQHQSRMFRYDDLQKILAVRCRPESCIDCNTSQDKAFKWTRYIRLLISITSLHEIWRWSLRWYQLLSVFWPIERYLWSKACSPALRGIFEKVLPCEYVNLVFWTSYEVRSHTDCDHKAKSPCIPTVYAWFSAVQISVKLHITSL